MSVTVPFLVSSGLLLLLVGWLLGRSSPDRPDVEWLWNELEYLRGRIEPLKEKIEEMTELYVREKKRASWLRHRLREANRGARWGKSLFSNSSLLEAHKAREMLERLAYASSGVPARDRARDPADDLREERERMAAADGRVGDETTEGGGKVSR